MHLKDAVGEVDAGATVPAVAPNQFGATTAGPMGTRYCIPAKPAMQLAGNWDTMRVLWLQTQRGEWILTRTGIYKATVLLDGGGKLQW